jgi:hypothetical protein
LFVVAGFSSSYNAGPVRQWRHEVAEEMFPSAPESSQPDRELALKEREIAVKEREIAVKEKQLANRWRSPLFLAIIAGAIGLFGSLVVAFLNNQNTQSVEHFRAQSNLVLEAIKTNGDSNAVCKNLTFFVKLA